MEWEQGTTICELDREAVMSWKQTKLKDVKPLSEGVNLRYVGCDLTKAWRQSLPNFNAQLPSLWIVEGLLYYLSEEQVRTLMAQISELCAAGSRIGLDVVNQPEQEAASFSSCVSDPESFFSSFGFQVSVTQPGDQEAHFGRFTRPLPVRVPSNQSDRVRRAFLVKLLKV